jgi:hypothetical protein
MLQLANGAQMDTPIESTADKIEKRARELCIADGLDPDVPAPEGWDDAHPGARWRGYAEEAKRELIAEGIFAGPEEL